MRQRRAAKGSCIYIYIYRYKSILTLRIRNQGPSKLKTWPSPPPTTHRLLKWRLSEQSLFRSKISLKTFAYPIVHLIRYLLLPLLSTAVFSKWLFLCLQNFKMKSNLGKNNYYNCKLHSWELSFTHTVVLSRGRRRHRIKRAIVGIFFWKICVSFIEQKKIFF